MGTVPVAPSDLTGAWIDEVLAPSAVSPRTGPPSVERVGEGYGLTSVLFRVAWTTQTGPRSVVVKLWDTGGAGGRAIVLDWARCGSGPAAIDLADVVFMCTEPGAADADITAWREEVRRVAGIEMGEAAIRHQLGGVLLRRFVTFTCGMTRWIPASDRETAMIEAQIDRILAAARSWVAADTTLLPGA